MTNQDERQQVLAAIADAADRHDVGDPNALRQFYDLIDQAQIALGADDHDVLYAELRYLQSALAPVADTYILRDPDGLPGRMAAAGLDDPILLAVAELTMDLTELRCRIGDPFSVSWSCGLDPTHGAAREQYESLERAENERPLVQQTADAAAALTRVENQPAADGVARLVGEALEDANVGRHTQARAKAEQLAALRTGEQPTTVERLMNTYLSFWAGRDDVELL